METSTPAAPQPLAPLPPDVMQFWVEHYQTPFVDTIAAYREQFPHRRAAVDLPVFLFTITPVPGEVVQ